MTYDKKWFEAIVNDLKNCANCIKKICPAHWIMQSHDGVCRDWEYDKKKFDDRRETLEHYRNTAAEYFSQNSDD